MRNRICTECGDGFEAPNRRSHLELCDGCLHEKQLTEWDNSIDLETIDGIVHMEVVRRFTVTVPA